MAANTEINTLENTLPFQLTKTIRRDPYPAVSPENPKISAAGKIIVITGAGTGLGAAAAQVWARANAAGIVLTGRRENLLQETAAKVRAINEGKTQILILPGDMTQEADVEKLFQETIKTFGRSPDVVLANAGVGDMFTIAEHEPKEWWNTMEVNLKGVFLAAHYFIKTQPDPKNPVGTFVTVNSGLAGMVLPGCSAYSLSKLAGQRFVEYLDAEYPTLRSFTVFPGIVETPMTTEWLRPYALDHADLTGGLCLYLATSQADYLKGCLTSINWDVEEMDAAKERIVNERLLKLTWLPILPINGGKGL